MRKFGIFMLAMLLAPALCFADDGQVINMTNTQGGGHDEGTPPEVIYDGGDETLTVELDLTAPAAYVEVVDDATGATEAAAPLAAGENVVPVPALDAGSYTVTVTLADGTAYEGTLLIE